MKKKSILLILLTVIIALGVVATAYAIGVSGDYNGGSIDNSTEASGGSQTYYPPPYIDGIRISIVRADGTNVSSKDFLIDNHFESNKNTKVYATKNQCSKASYVNGKCNLSWNGGDTEIGEISQNLNEVETIFKKVEYSGGAYTFPINLASKVGSDSFSNIFDGLYKEANSSLTEEKYNEIMYQMLENLLTYYDAGKIDDYVVDGEENMLYDLFIVFEPVTVVNVWNKLYMGTAYELAVMAMQEPGGGFIDSQGVSKCAGSSYGALCDLGAVLRKTIPCKSYLDGSIITSMQEKNSTVLIKTFSKDSKNYFGKIEIDYDKSEINKCSGSNERMLAETVTGNHGVGIGVLWVNDVYSSNDQCSYIKSNIVTTGWQNKFEDAFYSNGVAGIYELYEDTVSSEYRYGYIKYKGKTGIEKADLKWFVNYCTCYGMYDYYYNNDVKNFTNVYQVMITNLGKKIGNEDGSWYKKLHLFNATQEKINSLLDNRFSDYNKENADYAKEHGLEWTDADKLYKELNCGVENRWCDHFEEWYTENKPSEFSDVSTYKIYYNENEFNADETISKNLQTMINAYNLQYRLFNDFKWSLTSDNGTTTYNYINRCLMEINCSNVDEFYNDMDIKLDKYSCDAIANFDFSQFNNAYGSNINGNWYKAKCGCTNNTDYQCTPNYGLGKCLSDDNTFYKDSKYGIVNDKYWDNCVFNDYGSYDIDIHKVSDKNNDLTYYEEGINSKYCEVYCIEDLTASLANPNINVEAGSRFTWGYSEVNGSRTCKTKFIDWDSFESDLDDANEAIVEAYTDYMLEEAKKESIENAKKNGKCVYNTEHLNCCKEEKPVLVKLNPTKEECESKGFNYNSSNNTCYKENIGAMGCYTMGVGVNYTKSYQLDGKCYLKKSNMSYKCIKKNNTKKYTAKSVNITINTIKVSWGGKTWTSGETAPTYDVDSKKTVYDNAVKKANGIIDAMKTCYDWDEQQELIYNVDPKATIYYSDDVNYSYSGDLNKVTNYSFNTNSDCEDYEVDLYSCKDKSCSGTVTIKKCTYNEATRNARTIFTLPSNVYRYVLKSNHLSIHPADLANYDIPNFTENYIDIGFSNFPVSFSLKEGIYGTEYDTGQLDVKYSNLGHIKNDKTMIDTILSNVPTTDDKKYGEWICEYKVYNKLFPQKNSDINLIYRPIDLDNPFPDIDASTRDTGSNWCDEDGDCSYNNKTVETYIYNNRNVEKEKLYQEEPMYTFILTPSIIKQIRDYNDNNSYDSYTGSLGTGQYFDYVCDSSTGRGCVSEYLTYIIDITNAKDNPGTCVDDKFRNAKDINSFYECRY